MFPLKTDYIPGGPLAQISASDLNTIGEILNSIEVDLGEIEKPACPSDALPWKIKIRSAIIALVNKLLSGEGDDDGDGGTPPPNATIPGRVEYLQPTSTAAASFVQHGQRWNQTLGKFEEHDPEGWPVLVTLCTPHSAEHSS